jgi:hypothetical protein
MKRLEAGEIIADSDEHAGKPSPEPTDILLPQKLRLAPAERPYVVRLVRLLRDNYWASELVRQILEMEAGSRHQLTIKKIQNLLSEFDTIETLAHNAKKKGGRWCNHPILRAIRNDWTEIDDYIDECSIRNLIESAKS